MNRNQEATIFGWISFLPLKKGEETKVLVLYQECPLFLTLNKLHSLPSTGNEVVVGIARRMSLDKMGVRDMADVLEIEEEESFALCQVSMTTRGIYMRETEK